MGGIAIIIAMVVGAVPFSGIDANILFVVLATLLFGVIGFVDDMLKIDARFCTEIGIPNVNMAKASGVTDNEVEANNVDTKSKVSLWLETIKDGLNKVNDMFDLNLSVKLRFEGSENNVAVNTRNI